MKIEPISRYQTVKDILLDIYGIHELDSISKFMKKHKEDNSPEITVYHDCEHMYAVALECDAVAVKRNMPMKERGILIMAALFHDYYHSYGICPDNINIIYACHTFLNSNLYFTKMSTDDLTKVVSAIQCTQYPFKIRPTNQIECILRDADLTMSLQIDADKFSQGLTYELAHRSKDAQVITRDIMYDFAKSCRFYTLEIAAKFGHNHCYRFKKEELNEE